MTMILLTGAGGYIGKKLVDDLENHRIDFRSLSLKQKQNYEQLKACHNHKSPLKKAGVFQSELEDVDQIVFLAGANTGSNFINVQFPAKLAQSALEVGRIKRFIFVSTAKVYGEFSCSSKGLGSLSELSPKSNYSKSKMLAETELRRIFLNSGIELIIFRIPNIIGPKSAGIFRFLVNSINRGMPLPMRDESVKKSFLARNDLSQIITEILLDSSTLVLKPSENIFHLKSGEYDIEYLSLLNLIGHRIKKRPKIFHVPSERYIPSFLLNSFSFSKFKSIYSGFAIQMNESDLSFTDKISAPESLEELIIKSI